LTVEQVPVRLRHESEIGRIQQLAGFQRFQREGDFPVRASSVIPRVSHQGV